MTVKRKTRMLLAKIGLDGHNIGIKYISSLLREEGIEVIYLGLYQTPEKVVMAAIQEDVDIIGLSFLGGDHLTLVPSVFSLLTKKQANIPVVIGGVIPRQDIPLLRGMGVAAVFEGGTQPQIILDTIKNILHLDAE